MGPTRKNRPSTEKYKNIDPETLYVENLPKNFTEDEVVNLFLNFARPSSVFFNQQKSFAFVRFENAKIASSVLILAKQKYPEFDFKPAVQNSTAKQKHKLIISDNIESVNRVLVVQEETSQAMAPPMFIPRINSHADPDSYTKDIQEAVMLALERVFVKRQRAKDLGLGHCVRCSIPATKQCGNCGAYYCSEVCQEVDWTMGGHEELCFGRKIFNEGSFNPELASLRKSNQRVHNGFSKESERESERPRRKSGESDRIKSFRNGYDDKFDRRVSENGVRGKTDDGRKSFEDKGARSKVQTRYDEPDKEKNESRRDFRSDNRSNRDSRGPRAERNDKRGEFGEEKESWERTTERKNQSQFRDSPRKKSSPPDKRRDSPKRRSSPERMRESPKTRSPPPSERRRSPARSERRRSPPRSERNCSPPRSERRRSPPPVRRLVFEENKQKAVEKPLEPVEVKKDMPKMKDIEKPKAKDESLQTLLLIGLVRESKDSYWVLEEKDLQAWQELQSTLQEVCENAPAARPEIGLVCGCLYEDMWYRGKIVSIEPKIEVHYLDYGNTSHCESNIKKLPDFLSQSPGLAFLIKFDKGTPIKYETNGLDGETFSVQVVKETKDFYLIRFVGEDYSAVDAAGVEEEKKEPPKKKISAQARLAARLDKPKRRHVWDSVEESISGLLNISSGIGRTVYGSLIPENDEEAVSCFDEMPNLEIPQESGITAKKGDFILASDGQNLTGRGEVIYKFENSYIVNFVDHGQCSKTQQVYPLPDKVKNYPEIGVKIQITKVVHKSFDVKYVEKEEIYFFEITGPCEDNKWPCKIKTADDNSITIATGLISKWNCPVVPLSYAPVESGSTVLFSSLINLRTIYVKPASKECNDTLDAITERLSKYSSTAKKFEEPPSVGQLLCARFEDDGNFYRAVVVSIKGELFNVKFVDYGNDQKTKLEDLLPLPKELMEYPCFATKIHLKHVVKDVKCPDVSRYFSKLTDDNVELVLSRDGDEAILTEKLTGRVVNEFAKEKIEAFTK